MSETFRIATAQYPVGFFTEWQEYAAHAGQWVQQAAQQQAQLLVFPEYFSMELASLFGESVYRDLHGQLGAMQQVYPDFLQLFSTLAQQHGLTIVAGTFPVEVEPGRFVNRASLFRPDGSRDHQDKIQMTRFEAEQWHISPSDEVRALASDFGPLGISICYDSEFPLIGRCQVEQGARLIIVPSCTDALAGYYRVRIGSQARALENQCYVVQASLVGEAAWSEAVDVNCGAAAVYTPVDRGFPSDGILAIGELNVPQWVYADVDLSEIDRVRHSGQVFNHRDWAAQARIKAAPKR